MELKVAWCRKPNIKGSVDPSQCETLLEIAQEGKKEELQITRDKILDDVFSYHREHNMTVAEANNIKKLLECFFQDEQFNWFEYHVKSEPDVIYQFLKNGDRHGLKSEAFVPPGILDNHNENIHIKIVSPYGIFGDGKSTVSREKVEQKNIPLLNSFYNAQHLARIDIVSTNLGLCKNYTREEIKNSMSLVV